MNSTVASVVVLALFCVFLLVGALWGIHLEDTIGTPGEPNAGWGILVGAGTGGALGFFVGLALVALWRIRSD